MKAHRPNNEEQAWAMRGILASMVTARGQRSPEPVELECLGAIGNQLLGVDVTLSDADPPPLAQLRECLADPEQRLFALRICLVLGLVGEAIDPALPRRLTELAEGLHIDISDELSLLALALARRHKRLLLKITRRAASDYWAKGGRPGLRDWLQVLEQGFFIGRIQRPAVTARYRALSAYPEGTLGRAIYDFYEGHGYALPGEKGGMPEHFMLHECTHILSGYDTDPTGEMLVTAFTAGTKRRHVMDWVFVSLLQWHLGASVGSFTTDVSCRGLLQPEAFFHAWTRGMDMRLSLMDDPWDWWDVVDVPVTELRQRYGIAPLRVAQRPV